MQFAAVKNCTSPALTILPVTMTAPSTKYFAARFNVGCGRIGIGLRDVGRVPRLPRLRERDQAAA